MDLENQTRITRINGVPVWKSNFNEESLERVIEEMPHSIRRQFGQNFDEEGICRPFVPAEIYVYSLLIKEGISENIAIRATRLFPDIQIFDCNDFNAAGTYEGLVADGEHPLQALKRVSLEYRRISISGKRFEEREKRFDEFVKAYKHRC